MWCCQGPACSSQCAVHTKLRSKCSLPLSKFQFIYKNLICAELLCTATSTMPVGNEVVEQRSVGGRVVALEKSAADITLQYEKYVDALDIKKHRPYTLHSCYISILPISKVLRLQGKGLYNRPVTRSTTECRLSCCLPRSSIWALTTHLYCTNFIINFKNRFYFI